MPKERIPRRWLLPSCLTLLVLMVGVSAQAQTPDLPVLMIALRQGGHVIVLRHGATNRDQADTDPLHHDNVAQQRLLSAKGKEQATQMGEAFKKLGIPLGTVYTSKFNRAMETGALVSGGTVTATLDVTEGGLEHF